MPSVIIPNPKIDCSKRLAKAQTKVSAAQKNLAVAIRELGHALKEGKETTRKRP